MTEAIIKPLGKMNPNSNQRGILFDANYICPTLQAAMGTGGSDSDDCGD